MVIRALEEPRAETTAPRGERLDDYGNRSPQNKTLSRNGAIAIVVLMVIIVVPIGWLFRKSIGAFTARVSYSPSAHGGPTTPGAEVVRQYYRLWNSRDFASMYTLLSTKFKNGHPYNQYVKAHSFTTQISVDAKSSESPFLVTVRIKSSDREQDGTLSHSVFAGVWHLIRQNGAWRLDSESLHQISATSASYPTSAPTTSQWVMMIQRAPIPEMSKNSFSLFQANGHFYYGSAPDTTYAFDLTEAKRVVLSGVTLDVVTFKNGADGQSHDSYAFMESSRAYAGLIGQAYRWKAYPDKIVEAWKIYKDGDPLCCPTGPGRQEVITLSNGRLVHGPTVTVGE